MKCCWLSTGQASRSLGVSRQKLWRLCDLARNVDHFRGFVNGEHWRHDGRGYLVNVDHPGIKEAISER